MAIPGGIDEDDLRILKLIALKELKTTPKTVIAVTDIEAERVKYKMRKLKDAGFLRTPSDLPDTISPRGMYEATELGRVFAEGEITIDEALELVGERGER